MCASIKLSALGSFLSRYTTLEINDAVQVYDPKSNTTRQATIVGSDDGCYDVKYPTSKIDMNIGRERLKVHSPKSDRIVAPLHMLKAMVAANPTSVRMVDKYGAWPLATSGGWPGLFGRGYWWA